MAEQYNILLVEDDVNFGSVLKSFLEMNGYAVSLCDNGEKGYAAFRSAAYDICLVDVMMPFKDGFTLVKEIRKYDDKIPVVFITAKSLKHDVLNGFEVGADDYITKPFDSEILLQKMKALLRRTSRGEAGKTDVLENYTIGKFNFNAPSRTLQGPEGIINLSPKEAGLLQLLCASDNNLAERHKALVKLWGEDNYFTARSMDVYITRLRGYLKPDPSISIINIQRKGFRLVVASGN